MIALCIINHKLDKCYSNYVPIVLFGGIAKWRERERYGFGVKEKREKYVFVGKGSRPDRRQDD